MSNNNPEPKVAEETGKNFNIKTAPLNGVHILEANAGTGKTFSLSGLYLKFLFNGTSIDNLVAITYTKAAAEEIFKRVKGDLAKLIEVLGRLSNEGSASPTPTEKKHTFNNLNLLEEYVKLTKEKQQSTKAHLEKSLRNFDEHNIFTIHGFAHRLIDRYQLELGLSGAKEVLPQDEYFFQEAFMDFWRKYITELHPLPLVVFETYYPLSTLRVILKKFYDQPKLHAYPTPKNQPDLHQKNQSILDNYEQLKKVWNKIIAAIPSDPNEIKDLKAKVKRLAEEEIMNRNRSQGYAKEFTHLLTLFGLGNLDLFLKEDIDYHKSTTRKDFKPSLLGRYSYHDFVHLVKKDFKATIRDYIPPQLQKLFQIFDEFMNTIAPMYSMLQEYIISVIHLGISHIRHTGKELRKQSALLSFNDLLTDLEDNLTDNKKLLQEIAKNYPVFLIDEFQDTDPIQFRIFSSLAPQVQAMYFIADPKQSIYGFRQANINIYFEAKRRFPNTLYLGENYRSTPQMVEAVNFLYTHRQPLFSDKLSYRPSKAGLSSPSINNHKKTTVLTSGITLLINDSETGYKKKDDSIHSIIPPLRETLAEGVPANRIGILVRTRNQGKKILSLLKLYGIPAHTEGMDDLIESPTAIELYYLLHAIVVTSKAGSTHATFRAALTVDWLVAGKTTTLNIHIDESSALTWWRIFQESFTKWSQHGVYVMLHDLLEKLGTATYLIGKNKTNTLAELYDLIDLLKNSEDLLLKEHILPSPENLLSNFALQIKNPYEYSQQMNPSAKKSWSSNIGLGDSAVVISTLHKSKGLEYEVVFLPFMDQTIDKRLEKIFNLNHFSDECENNTQVFDLRFLSEDENRHYANNITQTKEYAWKDTLCEELRLLYVGLTRAKRKLYLSLHLHKDYRKSPLYYLLHLREESCLKKLWELYSTDKKNEKEKASIHSTLFNEIAKLVDSGNRTLYNKKDDTNESPVFSYKLCEPETIEVHENQLQSVPAAPLSSSSHHPFPQFIPIALTEIKSGGETTSFSSMTTTTESATPLVSTTTISAKVAPENSITNATNEKTLAVEQLDDETTTQISEVELVESHDHRHPLLTLPAGAHTGLFFHELLEQINFYTAHQHKKATAKLVHTTILKYFSSTGLSRSGLSAKALLDTILEMLNTLGSQPIANDIPALKNICKNNNSQDTISSTKLKSLWLTELDFNLYVKHSPEELYDSITDIINHDLGFDKEISTTTVYSKNKTMSSSVEYPTRFLDSYVRGFIDLVFNTPIPNISTTPSSSTASNDYPKRYFVLDWKSNFLGITLTDYQPSALHRAMLAGNYYLQGYLYTLAIDRHLSNLANRNKNTKTENNNYNYETHCGGFIYVFLRGFAFKESEGFTYPAIVHKPSIAAMTKLRKLFHYEK